MKSLIAIATLLLTAAIANAGDASNYRSLGFSKDAKYFAFAQTGINDGSGSAYAKVQVIEVSKNSLIAIQEVKDDDAQMTEKKALEIALRSLELKRFGIEAGRNLGTDLLVRLPTDHSGNGPARFATESGPEGGASPTHSKYELRIEEKDAPLTPENKWCENFSGNKMIKVSLIGVEASSLNLVLQDDVRQPKSRVCATGFSVKRVTMKGNALVVVLMFVQPGYEGPNYRYMIVSGKVALR